ncbi:hypothetical protein FLONG3_2868 [Fusarium longipes]|uniref:Uncharacterized protein n=1 Tax=Fusarium longipes TaxID=694270 RepID=A0A395T3Q3_9HYPO|nr:hypothetical protein FLONG3_2868 [Fusarium longipes]
MESISALEPRHKHQAHIPKEVPQAGDAMALLVTLASTTLLSIFIYKKVTRIQSWEKLPLASWRKYSYSIDALIYVFLVEKAHAVQSSRTRRRDSKLYLFNIITLLVGYFIVAVMNFYYRFARLIDGTCYIGMERISMIPLIAFDFIINIYLTILFLLPLTNLYSFKKKPQANSNNSANNRLRTVAWRTFIGACCTLTSSVVNLTVIMVLVGEPGWLCFMLCNSDVLFSAIVIQWVTSGEGGSGSSQSLSPSKQPSSSGRSASQHTGSMRSRNNGNHHYDLDDEIHLITSPSVKSSTTKSHVADGVLVTTTTEYETRSTTDDRESLGDSQLDFPPLNVSRDINMSELEQTHVRGTNK